MKIDFDKFVVIIFFFFLFGIIIANAFVFPKEIKNLKENLEICKSGLNESMQLNKDCLSNMITISSYCFNISKEELNPIYDLLK